MRGKLNEEDEERKDKKKSLNAILVSYAFIWYRFGPLSFPEPMPKQHVYHT